MSKSRELFIRVRTAIVFGAVMLGCIYYNVYSYLVLMAFIMLASIYEFQNVLKPTQTKNKVSFLYKPLSYLIALLFFGATYSLAAKTGFIDAKLLLIFPALLFLFFVIELFAHSKAPFLNVAINILGVVYLCLPFSLLHFVSIREDGYQCKIVFAILFLIWTNDSFAYFAGVTMGKHKMLPRISPGKTWEGIAGGIVGAMVAAIIMHYTFELHFLRLADWIWLSIIISMASTLGDLAESMLKRSLHIKDSGKLLPGHGGVLDRFDAFYFAVPFAALYLVLAGKI